MRLHRFPLQVFVLLACAGLAASACDPPQLCGPEQSRLGFFSKGDCSLANQDFFQGHEWITYLANQDLPEGERFNREDLHAIAEGNRRVDWPQELLVHMNNGAYQYMQALTEYTDRPEIQRLHFLLDDKNDSRQAADDSMVEIRRLTLDALDEIRLDRERGLTLLGRANHIIQDSFSRAHTVRDEENGWCLLKVKAYIKRAKGADGSDVEYHGESGGESVGHITPEDSIYQAGRSCHEPQGVQQVEACLNASAGRARLATTAYLKLVLVELGVLEPADDERDLSVDDRLEQFAAEHLSFCE